VSFWLGVAWLCLGGDALAQEPAEPSSEVTEAAPSAPASDEPSFLAEYAPAAIEGPGLRLPEPMTHLYFDGGYARTNDLSGLPLVTGSAHNYRFAAGGSLRWRRFSFDGELTFSNITTIDITSVQGQPLFVAQDSHQTATSLGDLRLGINWTTPLDAGGKLVGGFGLRTRLPTHTVIFQFHLIDNSLAQYLFPYFFHIEPTLILGGSLGRFGFVVNEGLLVMTGPDGNYQQLHIVEPRIWFWSAHYALVYSPVPVIGLSADLGTDVQVNHVTAMYFEQVNGIVSASLNLGLQVHLGRFRIDVVGRRGLTRDSAVFGVLQYAGTQSLTLRLGLRFD
jgi:hypothetical protein